MTKDINHEALVHYLDNPHSMFLYLTWVVTEKIRKSLSEKSNVVYLQSADSRQKEESTMQKVLDNNEKFVKRKIFRNRRPRK